MGNLEQERAEGMPPPGIELEGLSRAEWEAGRMPAWPDGLPRFRYDPCQGGYFTFEGVGGLGPDHFMSRLLEGLMSKEYGMRMLGKDPAKDPECVRLWLESAKVVYDRLMELQAKYGRPGPRLPSIEIESVDDGLGEVSGS